MSEARIETTVHIAAPPERVWATIVDTRRYAEWVVNTDEVVSASSDVADEGVRYEERNTVAGPVKGRSRWRVESVDPGRGTVHVGEGIAVARWMRLELTVEPDGSGTRYVHGFSYEPALGRLGPVVNSALGPLLARDMRRTAESLKELCEREAGGAGGPRPFPDVPGVPVEHSFVHTRGLRFHVAHAGPPDGEPLVLLHGWPQHWYMWRKVLPALAGRYRVVMPDLRGLGWSDAPPQGYDKESLADDVLAVLDALGLDHVKLVGHDWGGWIGFLIALRAPERLERFVALNIPPPWSGAVRNPLTALGLWRFWYQVVLASPWLGERVASSPRRVARLLRADNVQPDAFSDADAAQFADALREPARARASVQIYRAFLTRELPGLVRGRYSATALRVPTLLLFGRRDFAIAPALVKDAARPGDTLEVELVPDSGHFIADEKPELVAERSLSFLEVTGH